MQPIKTTFLSAATNAASERLVHMLSTLEVEHLLSLIGLTRRSSWQQKAVLLGAGAAFGGLTVLLLEPSSFRSAILNRLGKKPSKDAEEPEAAAPDAKLSKEPVVADNNKRAAPGVA